MSSFSPGAPQKNTQLRVLQMCAVDFTARQFLLPLTAALELEGYAVAISCARGPWFEEMESRGFRLVDNPVSRSANIWKHAKSLFRTVRLLRQENISILHVHTPVAALVGRLAGRLAGTPLILYTAHGFYFHENSRPFTRRALILLEKLGALCGDFIMTVSAEDREAAIRYGIAKPENVETIYNGVDTLHFDPRRFTEEDRYAFRERHGIPKDARVIGMLGRLVREKGFFEFFEAAKDILAYHPDTWFMAVGDVLPSDYDGRQDELRQHIESLGVAHRVIFTGMVNDPAPALNSMDVFCLPSYREGMPISLLEAMAMARPCVASDIRGCREEVVDGETGYLVPARQSAPLSQKIIALLDNPERAATMGVAGRNRVLEHFDIRKVVDHQLAIYRRLVEKNNLRSR